MVVVVQSINNDEHFVWMSIIVPVLPAHEHGRPDIKCINIIDESSLDNSVLFCSVVML